MKTLTVAALMTSVQMFYPCGVLFAGELQFIVVHEEPFDGAKRIEVPEMDLEGWRKETPDVAAGTLTGVELLDGQLSHWSQLNTKMEEVESGVSTNYDVVISIDSNTQKAIKKITAEHFGKRMLIQYGDTPLIAPVIRVPIDTPSLSISLSGKEKARDLHDKLKALVMTEPDEK